MSAETAKYKLGIIGAGNMSGAITDGIIKSGILNPSEILVSDVDTDKLARFNSEKGVFVTTDNKLLAEVCQNVLFAVKPQSFAAVAEDIRDRLKAEFIISIMAGIKTDRLRAVFGFESKICRIMPNTPCVIRRGISAMTYVNFDETEKIFSRRVFESLGQAIELSEDKFDAVTAVSGSGPAYVYTFLNAMIEGGVSSGLGREDAKLLASSVLIGAAELARISDKPLQTLRAEVTSRGGTTEAALKVFFEGGLEDIIQRGVAAAADRSRELGA